MRNLQVQIVLLWVLLGIAAQQSDFPFEKKLWSFWDAEGLQNAPAVVQACYQKIKLSADKAGFEYILLNSNNVKDYIRDYETKITAVRQRSKQKAVQHFADLVRFHIIHEHGGIWMDITEVLMDDFDWLLNIKQDKYSRLATNRFSEEVDVLLFYYSDYQNTAEYWVQDKADRRKIWYNQIPGYQIWFMAAKKDNPLIGAIAQTYSRFTQMTHPQMMALFQTQSIYMNNEDGDAYLSGNMAISYVLQRKQFQLDRQLGLFSGQRYTVYEYYKLWSYSALLGPLTWTNYEVIRTEEFLTRPKQYFEAKGASFNFFVKIVGDVTRMITKQLKSLQEIFKQGSFEEFMERKPGKQKCREVTFLVQGSIVSDLFKNTTHLSQMKVSEISVEQQRKWKQYCSEYTQTDLLDYVRQIPRLIFIVDYQVIVAWFRVHEIIDGGQNTQSTAFSQNINRWWFTNKGGIQIFLRFTLLIALITLGYGFINSKIQQYMKRGNSREMFRLVEEGNTKLRYWALKLVLIMIVTVSGFRYYMIELFGQRDDAWGVLSSVLVVLLLQFLFERGVVKVTRQEALSLEVFYESSHLFVSYFMAYSVLSLMVKNKTPLQFYSIVYGLLLPILINLSTKLYQSHQFAGHFIIKLTNALSQRQLLKVFTILVLGLIALLNNLRYLVVGQQYVIKYLVEIAAICVLVGWVGFVRVVVMNKLSIDLVRLLVVGGLVMMVCYLIPVKNQYIVYNRKKGIWNLLLISLFQCLYVQTNGLNLIPSQRHLSLVINFFGLTIMLSLSSFWHMKRIDSSPELGVLELALMLINNLIVIWYQFVVYGEENTNQHKQVRKIAEFEKFQEVEMYE